MSALHRRFAANSHRKWANSRTRTKRSDTIMQWSSDRSISLQSKNCPYRQKALEMVRDLRKWVEGEMVKQRHPTENIKSNHQPHSINSSVFINHTLRNGRKCRLASDHSVLCAAAAATFLVVFHECRTHSGKLLCSRNHSRMNRMVFGSAGYPLPKSPTSPRSVSTA